VLDQYQTRFKNLGGLERYAVSPGTRKVGMELEQGSFDAAFMRSHHSHADGFSR
jgi:hypothetical protein